MTEKKYDKALHIKTIGIREWPDGIVHYNRCEPTPYKALDILLKNYKINKKDKFVDFGSGSGRVAFYIHNRFQISVIGIEGNIKVYDEAINNMESYMQRANYIDAPIQFKHTLAEYYKVGPSDNIFYFFNPFSVEIFQDVVGNILDSLEIEKRAIDIILYYPMVDYKEFLEASTSFELFKEIKIPEIKDKLDKFLIYRLIQGH